MASPDKKNEITEKETQVLAMAWSCFKTPPEVDFDKLAKLTGYTNPRSLKNVLYAIKKKIALIAPEDDNDGEGPSTPVKRAPKAKATPGSRKRKATGNGADDSGDSATATPSKRARGKKPAASQDTAAGEDSESDGKGETVKKVAK